MNKKLYYLFGSVFLILAAAIFADFSFLNRRITNALFQIGSPDNYEQEVTQQTKEAVKDIYKTSFLFSKYKTDTVTTYIPRYDINTAEQAAQYASLFDILVNEYVDNENAYIYRSEDRSLSVYKFINLIHYENTLAEKSGLPGKIVSNEQAVSTALKFIKAHGLSLKYSETVVNFEDGTYMVTFADKLGDIADYAFPTVVVVNDAGEVVSMDYYYFAYERLASCSVKPMKQAFYELPVDFPENTKIDLNRCTLVYTYENSILQPAYLFEGELAGGGTFRCFVNAAVYK